MKLVLIATALLFYTQVTETKECYAITETEQDFEKSKDACKSLNGKMSSEDLLDSENVGKAVKTVNVFRDGIDSAKQNPDYPIWLGISVRNMDNELSETDNPLSFSDGTKVDNLDRKQLLKWSCLSSTKQPLYNERSFKCGRLTYLLVMDNSECNYVTNALCTVPCEDASSGSKRSRANLPFFALFAAASVFKATFALIGPVF